MKSSVLEKPLEKKHKETPDTKKHEMPSLKGNKREHLTKREEKDRERNMEVIQGGVTEWVKREGIQKLQLNKAQLSGLVRFLHETSPYKEALYAISDHFNDRKKYSERPGVLVYEAGKEGNIDVDIYLLGWRCPIQGQRERDIEEGVPEYLAGADRTYIHDHEATEVGIEVLNYDPVTEKLYITPTTQTAKLEPKDRVYCDPNLSEGERVEQCTIVERQFSPGSNVQVSAPYIHQFQGPQTPGEHGMAVTLHAYSTEPDAIPEALTPADFQSKKRKGGLYKMNYFELHTDTSTGAQTLTHVGYYTMFKTTQDQSDMYYEGVVEGVTSSKDLLRKKGQFMFC